MAHDLIITGGSYADGKFAHGLAGNGYGAADIVLDTAGSTDGYTIEWWAEDTSNGTDPTTRAAVSQLGTFYAGRGPDYIASAHYNTAGGEEELLSGVDVTSGKHHYALCIGPWGGVLYVDGVSVPGSTKTTPAHGSTTASVYVSRFNTGGGFVWNGVVDEVAITTGRKYTGTTFAVPTAPVSNFAPNLLALWHLNDNGVNSAGVDDGTAGILFPVTEDNTAHSPGNGALVGGKLCSVNGGFYWSTSFSGNKCNLRFDMNNRLAPFTQLLICVDGQTHQYAVIANTIIVEMPDNIDSDWHHIEVVTVAVSETNGQWTPQNTMVAFMGYMLEDEDQQLEKPELPEKVIWAIGDSTANGVRTRANDATGGDVFRNDVTICWSYLLRKLTGADVGVIAFGATGYTHGSGTIPKLPISINSLWDGQARDFTVRPPDLVICGMGRNDGSDVTADAVAFVNIILTNCPRARVMLLQPFAGAHVADLQAVIPACIDPSRVSFKSSAGMVPDLTSKYAPDGIHPYGWIEQAKAAIEISREALRLLYRPYGVAATPEQIAAATRTNLTTELGRIDAAITSRSSHSASDVWNVLISAGGVAGSFGKRVIDFLTGDAFVRLGAPTGASVSADITTVRLKTQNLPASPASTADVQPNITVNPTVLSGPSVTAIVTSLVTGIRTMDMFQRMTAKLGLFGFNRTKVGSVTSDTARREDGGTTVFAGNETTKAVTITSNTPGTGTGGNPGV